MTNSPTKTFTESTVFDNLLGLLCFSIFAAGVMYSSSRALPETPRVALIETSSQSVAPNMALLQSQDMTSDFSVREFRVVVR